MSTSNQSKLDSALAQIPKQFRGKIIKSFLEIKSRFAKASYDSSFDTSGLSAGKFCEGVLRFLQSNLDNGNFIPFGTHIQNFPVACRKLIELPKTAGLESLRIIIPRALAFLYTLRGKRGIGHVGGDIEPNAIDATTIVKNVDWIMCELIRVFHSLSLEEAQTLIDALSTRQIPDIWEIGGKKRVLRKDLSFKEKALLLTYLDIEGGVLSEDLCDWTEYAGLAMFKVRVLKPLHDEKLIEYNRESEVIFISPLGVAEVEERILIKKGI